MAEKKIFWALVQDLSQFGEGSSSVIVAANELYRYKAGHKCIRFKPKSSTLSDRNEEFGLVVGDKIVRHHIVSLSGTSSIYRFEICTPCFSFNQDGCPKFSYIL